MFRRLNDLKHSTFHSLTIIVDTLIDVRNETWKHDFKSVKINTEPYFPMRMFQSVSGHSSEQNIARYSSRPTVSQLKGVSDTISAWFENHQPQRTTRITRTRSNHEYKIRPKVARTNYFKYSLFHRYINDWNSLPFKVMSSPSLQSFKVSLIKYLR